MLFKTIIAAVLIALSNITLAATIEMEVNGLVCSFCAQGIEKTLRKNPATADVLVSLEDRLVAIVTKDGLDISNDELTKALTDAGYTVKAIARTSNSLTALRARIKEKNK
jgi:copper chaperone CopZ